MTVLERSFPVVIATAACLVVTVVVAFVAALYFSGEDHRSDIGRALGMDAAEKIDTSTFGPAFRARFPDGTPAASLDGLIADLHGTCADAPAAAGNVHRCELPIMSTFCMRTDIRVSARLAPGRLITDLEATVGTTAC